MLATALALQEVTKAAIFQEEIVDAAGDLMIDFESLTLDEFTARLYSYSMLVSAMAVTLTTDALLDDQQVTELMDSISEIEAMALAVQDGEDID